MVVELIVSTVGVAGPVVRSDSWKFIKRIMPVR
jgi:hypothetical protein